MGPLYKCVIIVSFLALAGSLGACDGLPPVRFQLGGLQGSENAEYVPPPPRPEMQVVTSDREAAAVAREILLANGSAADAAAGLGLTLAVTAPSSVSIISGGVCVARDAKGALEQVDFRDARLGRGLLGLHAKFGNRPWSSLVISAETLARFGHRVSPALADDIAKYGGVLASDTRGLQQFMTSERRLIAAGDDWRQPRLSDTLAKIRTPRFLDGNPPAWSMPVVKPVEVALTPGTTGFAVADAAGGAVACAITMGRPFGLGSMTRDGGYLFPGSSPQDLVLDQLALAFLTCLKHGGEPDKDAARCPAPTSTFSLMP
jgi:gamma-glutamyltranspeptidase